MTTSYNFHAFGIASGNDHDVCSVTDLRSDAHGPRAFGRARADEGHQLPGGAFRVGEAIKVAIVRRIT